jgi:hypothetical protein
MVDMCVILQKQTAGRCRSAVIMRRDYAVKETAPNHAVQQSNPKKQAQRHPAFVPAFCKR